MKILSVVLGSVLISGLFADLKQDLENCRDNNVNMDILESLVDIPSELELETLCPMIFGFLDCVENEVENHRGNSMEEIAESFPNPDIKNDITLYINLQSIARDVCTEGSDLNAAYKEHGSCLSSIDVNDTVCKDKALTAYETYKALQENLEEDTGEDFGKECLTEAYNSACFASRIRKMCGQGAFDVYRQVIKRSSVFRLTLCSEKELEILMTEFLHSLNFEERHELFRLVYDLRKRKK